MKILMYISNDIDGFGDYCLQEIAEPLKMNENTTYKNLNKLVEIGLLAKTVPKRARIIIAPFTNIILNYRVRQ